MANYATRPVLQDILVMVCGGICITECLDCHHVNGCLSDFEKTIKSKSSGNDIKSKLGKAAHEKNKKQRESNENWFTKRNFYQGVKYKRVQNDNR